MKVFFNKREKCVFFSKVGELLWLFFFYTLFRYSIFLEGWAGMVGMEYFSSLDSGIHIFSFLFSFFYSAMKKTVVIPSALSANHGSLPGASLPG